ncbi:MAG: DNA/RNA nuclease SfsA [Euryarchaeota archaeon]|nr:DNA/RNA nuclease SfsA [Euryarchaeota archaeon]
MDLGPLAECRFLDRPNRFLAHVEYRGRRVPCFLANPGRLRELLLPGAPALIRRVPPGPRKTCFDLMAVRASLNPPPKRGMGGVPVNGGKGAVVSRAPWGVAGRDSPETEWVCIDTRVPNRLFRLHHHHWVPFSGARKWRSEYTHGSSRFDFAYARGPRRGLVEVKCVTLVRDGVALFPDAPTLRGARHLDHLALARRRGWEVPGVRRSPGSFDEVETHAVFLVFRRASRLEPHGEMDPGFARALRRARRAGVGLHAYRFELRGERMVARGEIPVVACPPWA